MFLNTLAFIVKVATIAIMVINLPSHSVVLKMAIGRIMELILKVTMALLISRVLKIIGILTICS